VECSIEYGDGLVVTNTWLHAHPAWDTHLIPAVLSVLEGRREDTPGGISAAGLARDTGNLHCLHERFTPASGVREAILAVLVHPVTSNGVSLTSGEWILGELGILLFGDPGEGAEGEGGGSGSSGAVVSWVSWKICSPL
jgi:hypothetical protein